MSAGPSPDRAQLDRYFAALFKHADPAGFISLRIFGGSGNKLLREEAVMVGAPNRGDRIEAVARIAAQMDVAAPAYAPPVCSFSNPHRARVVDLKEGVSIVSELDERPRASLAVLVSYLGKPTLVLESGGRWKNPDTGREEPKLHAHWRLAVPARTADELQDLRTARRLVCDLVGADASAVSIVHPLRAAGSVHRKSTPRLARIVEENDVDLDLADALARLRAIPDTSFHRLPTRAFDRTPNPDQVADSDDIAAALAIIPNDGLPWDRWNEMGLAAWAATGGDWHTAFNSWESWSEKCWKYKSGDAEERWHHYFGSPPTKIGAGTIFWHAKQAVPGWVKPSERFDVTKWFVDQTAAPLFPELPGEPMPPGELERLNAVYCVVRDAGRTRVLHFEDERQKEHRRQVAAFLSFEDFRNFHMNKHIQVGKERVPLGRWWLEHPYRRQYEGLTFEPGLSREIGGRLNLWRGWGVEPAPGDWSLMRAHIREVMAAGDAAADRYIVYWIAWTVQNPARRAEVALVFKGSKGAGKGTLGNALCRIFGQHASHISSADHLAGRFNGHLRDAVFLFADEAYWPGDKAAEGALKRLVTEPDLFIEAKGKDAVPATNRLHVMMASNEAWIVPAGEHERRFAVFEVGEQHKQSAAWFGPLNAQMEAGGYAAMLYDLLRLDIGDFHPRQVLRTEALVEQQSRGLSPEDAWWCELLETGTLWGADPRRPDSAISNGRPDDPRPSCRRGLYDQAREVSPRLKGYSDHLLGKLLKSRGCDNIRKVMRANGWFFPPLSDARGAWELRFPNWPWRDPELARWQIEGEE